MKRLILMLSGVAFFTSCTIENIEPRYDARDRIIGYYEVEEYSETYNDMTYYSMRISKSGYSHEIYLHNFYAVDITVSATLDYDKIRIPRQVIDGYEIEGVGSVYDSELTMSYRVKDLYNHSYTDFCESKAWPD